MSWSSVPSLAGVFAAVLALSSGGSVHAAAPVGGPILPPAPAVTAPSPAAIAEAEAAYAEVQDAFGKGELARAEVAADRAFAALPNASTALIRATVLGALGRDRDAFIAALVAADLEPTADERGRIETLLGHHGAAAGLGWARVETRPSDADRRIGEARWTTTRTVGLPAGRQIVRVTADGHVAADLVIDVVAGAGGDHHTTLRADPVVDTGPAPEDPGSGHVFGTDKPKEAPTPWLPWTLIGAGGAALVGGAVMTTLAHGAADDAAAYATSDGTLELETREAKYNDARQRSKDHETVAAVLYGVGAASVITGVVLLLVDGDEPAQETEITGSRLTPLLGPTSAGVRLTF